MRNRSKASISVTGILLAACAMSQAATIAYVNVDYNVDLPANKNGTENKAGGWRTTTDAKDFDIDGDNVYGTDGYFLRGGNTTGSIPYITSAAQTAGGGNNFGAMDDPADPTGNDTFQVGFWGKSAVGSYDAFNFTVAGSTLDGQTLRVGVHFDGYSTNSGLIFTWTQTVGGSGTASSLALTSAGNGYDFAFFDISGATAGDKFVLSIADDTPLTSSWMTFDGVVFDTAPVPEPSTALLGGLGLLMLVRRRR